MKLNIFIITEFPEVTALEVRELVGKKSQNHENVCFVKNIDERDIVKLCYHLQSARRVCVEVTTLKVGKDIKASIKSDLAKLKINDVFLDGVETFAVRSEHNDSFELPSVDMSRAIGEVIGANHEKLSVDLSCPDITLFAYGSEKIFLGVDIVGFDMSKRPYKIAFQTDSLNGSFAYSLVRLAGVEKNSVVLDPFAGSGIIPIEVSLFQNNISIFQFENKFIGSQLKLFKATFTAQEDEERTTKRKFQKNITGYDGLLKHVLGMQKNAKLAGVEKDLKMSKVSVDWLDTKMEEGSVDFIITDPPKYSRRLNNEKDTIKLFDEMLYQAKYVLKKKGILAVLLNTSKILLDLCEKNNFKVIKKIDIKNGQQPYEFILLKKSK